jgi:hypothetical protein
MFPFALTLMTGAQDLEHSALNPQPSTLNPQPGLGLGLVGDSLFAAGGFDGAHEILSLVEKLDMSNNLSTEKWQLMVRFKA